jgi:hypothetical protein
MRNEEFEVVRDLIAGRAPRAPGHVLPGHALAPASFREIDGEILARQYVAHRKFLETEAMARKFGTSEELHDVVPRHRSGRQPAGDERSRGWLGSLARLLWRR